MHKEAINLTLEVGGDLPLQLHGPLSRSFQHCEQDLRRQTRPRVCELWVVIVISEVSL